MYFYKYGYVYVYLPFCPLVYGLLVLKFGRVGGSAPSAPGSIVVTNKEVVCSNNFTWALRRVGGGVTFPPPFVYRGLYIKGPLRAYLGQGYLRAWSLLFSTFLLPALLGCQDNPYGSRPQAVVNQTRGGLAPPPPYSRLECNLVFP